MLLRLWRRIPRNTLLIVEQCVVLVLEHLVVVSSLVAYASQIGSTTVLLTHRGRGLQPLLMVRSRCASVIWVDVFLLEFVACEHLVRVALRKCAACRYCVGACQAGCLC